MSEIVYKVRCDKHAFAPYDYCEMCMLRSQVQEVIETSRKQIKEMFNGTNLALHLIHKSLAKLEADVDHIKGFLVI